MFQNAFQSGPSVEIFDPKVSKEKEKTYANLLKIANNNLIKKIYDKSMKGYIYELDAGVNSKILFPKDDRSELALLQQYIVFQIFLSPFQAFGIDLIFTDTSKTKRRVNLTTAVNKIDLNFFHIKIPIDIIKRGIWLNLAIDVLSFMEGFKGQTFRSLDGIVIYAVCKLRKIYTLRYPPYVFKLDEEDTVELRDLPNAQEIPKNLNFPAGVSYMNQLISFDMIKLINNEKNDQQPQPLSESPFNQNILRSNPATNKFQKSGGTPIKEPPSIISKKTPIKSNNKPAPPQEEEYKQEPQVAENIMNDEEYKEKPLEENNSVFQPMGKAAGSKKNPWSSQDSKKSITAKTKVIPNIVPNPKIKEDFQVNGVKVNKRLDLNALKKKGSYKKQPSVEKISKKSPEKEKSPDYIGNEDYYEKSSKFNTVTDPRTFAPENMPLNKWSNEEISGENVEIEENIKENNESMRASKKIIKEKQISNFKSPAKRDIGTNFQTKKGEISHEVVTIEDNIEDKKFNESPILKESIEQSRVNNLYEEELNKMIKEDIRPNSPPFNNNKMNATELKNADMSKKTHLNETAAGSSQKNMLEVVYDPVLNCYYDPKTNSYYDLIN